MLKSISDLILHSFKEFYYGIYNILFEKFAELIEQN